MKKQRPDRNLIDRILKGRYLKVNQIFDGPMKAIPLPRKSGTINVTFSERAFPTPARESSFVEEQEVCVFFNHKFYDKYLLAKNLTRTFFLREKKYWVEINFFSV